MAGVALVSSLAISPAIGAAKEGRSLSPRLSLGSQDAIGAFTPASADARLAAALSRSGLTGSSFRFTPASSIRLNRSVTVAVRARSNGVSSGNTQVSLVAPTSASIQPIAYNLGVAVGWKKFAVQGDMARTDIVGLGRREVADVGVSYTDKRLTTRVQLAADRATGTQAALLGGSGVSVDFGSSYRLTRNLDVTAGVRYRAERSDRLIPRTDNRRDSQAVYVGTAFRF